MQTSHDRRAVAIHECGHSVVGEALGLPRPTLIYAADWGINWRPVPGEASNIVSAVVILAGNAAAAHFGYHDAIERRSRSSNAGADENLAAGRYLNNDATNIAGATIIARRLVEANAFAIAALADALLASPGGLPPEALPTSTRATMASADRLGLRPGSLLTGHALSKAMDALSIVRASVRPVADGAVVDLAPPGAIIWEPDRTTHTGALTNTDSAISPAQLTANTDNWNPTGLATTSVIRVSTDASRNLTGLVAPSGPWSLVLENVGAQDLVIKHDVTSTAANRFYCPNDTDLTLSKDTSVLLAYDTTSSRWRVVGGTVGATSSGTSASAASSGDVTVTGSLADVTGCTVSLTAGTYVVEGVFDVLLNTNPDRTFEGHLDVGGVDQTRIAVLLPVGLDTSDRQTISQTWVVTLGSTTTVKLRAKYSGGTAGDFTVKANSFIAAWTAGAGSLAAGRASQVGSATTTSGTVTALDGTNLTLTLTTGPRRVLIAISGVIRSSVGGNGSNVYVQPAIDGVGVGNAIYQTFDNSGAYRTASLTFLSDVLSAGSHTFKVFWARDSGTATADVFQLSVVEMQ